MEKLDLRPYKDRVDCQHLLPILRSFNDFVDEFNNPLVAVTTIRLGILKVEHTEGVETEVIGTCESFNTNTYYIPRVSMRIKGVQWFTNINVGDITPPPPLGEMQVLTFSFEDGIGSNVIQESITQSIDLDGVVSAGLGEQALYIKESELEEPAILEALLSNYALRVLLLDTTPSGTYTFEVYIDVEFVE